MSLVARPVAGGTQKMNLRQQGGSACDTLPEDFLAKRPNPVKDGKSPYPMDMMPVGP